MISFLGVSKAVLDNVIFCHQEESNWSVTSVNNIIFLLYCFTLHCILPHYNALHNLCYIAVSCIIIIALLLSAVQPSLLSTPLSLPFPFVIVSVSEIVWVSILFQAT